MRLLCVLLWVVSAVARTVAAEPVELIPGLTYLRVTNYPADSAPLASAIAANRPLIVDLRYPLSDGADQFPLETILAQRAAKSSAPLFVLVSPHTPAPIAAALGTLPRGAVTLGIEGSQPTPAVAVAQPAETDRRAHDAWSEKISLPTLITGKTEKERFDEAALVKEFRNGATVPPAPATVPETGAAKKDEERVPVLTDRVLQRAVHLHRALLALRQKAP